MEIREVTHGRDGYILASKTLNQKYHLVSKYSDVRLGDIVQANLIRDKDNYAIYECETIPDSRMVLKLVEPSLFDESRRNVAIWRGEQLNFINIPEQYIECQTQLFTRYQNGFTKLALVNYGDEEAVWNLIKESNIEKEVAD